MDCMCHAPTKREWQRAKRCTTETGEGRKQSATTLVRRCESMALARCDMEAVKTLSRSIVRVPCQLLFTVRFCVTMDFLAGSIVISDSTDHFIQLNPYGQPLAGCRESCSSIIKGVNHRFRNGKIAANYCVKKKKKKNLTQAGTEYCYMLRTLSCLSWLCTLKEKPPSVPGA